MRVNVDVLVQIHYSKDTNTEFTQVKAPIAERKDTIVGNVFILFFI